MEAYESKMRRAQELKTMKQKQLQQSAQSLTKHVDERLHQRQEQQQMTWMSEFEKNTLRRVEMEKRKKKRQIEAQEINNYAIQEKLDKKEQIRRRLED